MMSTLMKKQPLWKEKLSLSEQGRFTNTSVSYTHLSKCIDILAEQGIELTEEQKAEGQSIYSIVMRVHSDAWDAAQQDPAEVQKQNFNAMASTFSAVRAGGPRLSADAQWIEGLNGSYQYITKDTYDRVLK